MGDELLAGNEVFSSIFWSMVAFDSARVGNQQLGNLWKGVAGVTGVQELQNRG